MWVDYCRKAIDFSYYYDCCGGCCDACNMMEVDYVLEGPVATVMFWASKFLWDTGTPSWFRRQQFVATALRTPNSQRVSCLLQSKVLVVVIKLFLLTELYDTVHSCGWLGVVTARFVLGIAKQHHTTFKSIYSVGRAFVASVSEDFFLNW
jgi:hypothetical protein